MRSKKPERETSTMYAVIFKAEINKVDDSYTVMAKRMREIAVKDYDCINFSSITEGNIEVAISYWHSKEQIKQWKQNKEHLIAQQLGKDKWYKNYTVDIVEVIQQYKSKPQY